MTVRLSAQEWEQITLQLMVRSGGICEARTPACLAAAGGRLVAGVPVSRHHRQPRGRGGSALVATHDLSNLLLVCGDGTTGCHGFIESERTYAYGRGLLVHRGDDPAAIPLELASGRLVLLDVRGGFYMEIG